MEVVDKIKRRYADEHQEIRLARADLIYDALPSSLVTIVVASSIILAVEWPVGSRAALIGWYAGTVGVCLFRSISYLRYRRRDTARALAFWMRLAVLGALLSGITWGAIGWLMLPGSDLVHQMFLSLVLAGVAAVAITNLSAHIPMAMGFLFLALVPMIGYFLFAPYELGLITGVMCILFLTMLIASSLRFNRSITTTLTERFERRRAEALARRQALFDDLTDLPNRRSFLARLGSAISDANRFQRRGAVLFLDLDRFKQVNDSLGHEIGNILLTEFAQRIQIHAADQDLVARIGGDEFVILIPDAGADTRAALYRAQKYANAIMNDLNAPFDIDDHEMRITASVGIALFPGGGGQADDVLQNADVAMYRAKESGRNTVRFYEPEMKEKVRSRMRIERDLRWSLDNEGLFPVFQLQVNDVGRVVGAEMLLRWTHPVHGKIEPDEFIPIAEDTGLIYRLGERVLIMACQALNEFATVQPLCLSVNVSARQFRHHGFAELVRTITGRFDLDPSLLRFEITESAVMDDLEQSIDTMLTLKALGVTFAIDDFGTGYSSLAYLKRLPVDAIKIDKSFIVHLPENEDDAAIVNAVIAMASHLQLDVIAEGVENTRVKEFLTTSGCRQFQGFFLSPPLEHAAFLSRLGSVGNVYPLNEICLN